MEREGSNDRFSEKPESTGNADQYLEKFLHPHENLPEEMPEDFKQALGWDNLRDRLKENYLMVWDAIRLGTGELLLPESSGWGKAAEYITQKLAGEEPETMGGPSGGFASSLRHIFGNLGVVVSIEMDADSKIAASLGDISKARELIKETFDCGDELAEYDSIMQKLIDHRQAKSSMSHDQMRERDEHRELLLDQTENIREQLKSEQKDEEREKLAAQLKSLYMELGELKGTPWYFEARWVNEKDGQLLFESLPDHQRKILQSLRGKNPFPNLSPGVVGELKSNLERNRDMYLKRLAA